MKEPLTPAELRTTVAKDKTKIYQHGANEKLKLEDVLARALQHNLDTKVADLDELIAADDLSLDLLNSLPSISGKSQRVGRDNKGGSSSFSVLTGMMSLQPSISSDQYRNTGQLNAQWNLLDAGINLWRARSTADKQTIAQERRRKVYHGVIQDTYAAFWRVAVAQTALPRIEALAKESETQLARIDDQIKQNLVPLGDAQTAKSALQDRRQRLLNMRQGLALAETELKTLIDYPLDQPIALDLGPENWMTTGALPVVKGSPAALEKTALMHRPEIREELLNKRMTLRDIKTSIAETFPGADFLLSFNYDSNSFLVYDRWFDGVMGLTQSINKILTAPARISRVKNIDQLADKRRQALTAAVITQIRVTKVRYDLLSSAYHENQKMAQNTDAVLKRARDMNGTGMMSGANLLNVKIDSAITDINRAFSYAEAQDAYARLVNTMGIDLWEADDAGLSVPDYATRIRKNLANENLFLTADASGGKETP